MKPKHIGIAFLLAAASYATFAFIRQMQLIKQSCVKFVSYRFQKISLTYMRLLVTLQVKNNSDINVKILASNFDVFINGAFVSKIKTRQTVDLPAHSASPLNLNVEFDPRQVLKGAAQAMINAANNIQIQVKGRITVISSGIIISNIKVNETIALDEILKPGNKNNC